MCHLLLMLENGLGESHTVLIGIGYTDPSKLFFVFFSFLITWTETSD